MNKAVQIQAREIAQKVGGNRVGFIEILIPIISALIPALIQKFTSCIENNPVPSSPQDFVQHRYDEEKQEYDPRLLRLTIKEVREKAKDKGTKLSKEDAKEVAIKTLDQTRLAEDRVVGACFRSN